MRQPYLPALGSSPGKWSSAEAFLNVLPMYLALSPQCLPHPVLKRRIAPLGTFLPCFFSQAAIRVSISRSVMSASLLSGHEAKEVQSSRMPSPRKRSIGIWSRRQQCTEKGRECFSCIMWKDMHNAGLPINTNFDKSRRSCNASRTLSANCLQHRANISKFLQLLHIDIVNTFFTNSSVVDLTLFFRVTEMRRRIHMSSSVFRRFVVVSFDVKAPLRVISIDRLEMEMLVRRPVHGLIVKAVRQIKNRFIRFVNGFGQRHLRYYQQEGEQP